MTPGRYAIGPQITDDLRQIFNPVADGQFLTAGHHHPHLLDRPLIRMQGASWYFRSIYGRWGCFRSYGGNHSQSNVSVSGMCVLGEYGSGANDVVRHRANPTASYFASCAPDQPCITPGTYAFLGAAAALGYVVSIHLDDCSELTGPLSVALRGSRLLWWSSCLS